MGYPGQPGQHLQCSAPKQGIIPPSASGGSGCEDPLGSPTSSNPAMIPWIPLAPGSGRAPGFPRVPADGNPCPASAVLPSRCAAPSIQRCSRASRAALGSAAGNPPSHPQQLQRLPGQGSGGSRGGEGGWGLWEGLGWGFGQARLALSPGLEGSFPAPPRSHPCCSDSSPAASGTFI